MILRCVTSLFLLLHFSTIPPCWVCVLGIWASLQLLCNCFVLPTHPIRLPHIPTRLHTHAHLPSPLFSSAPSPTKPQATSHKPQTKQRSKQQANTHFLTHRQPHPTSTQPANSPLANHPIHPKTALGTKSVARMPRRGRRPRSLLLGLNTKMGKMLNMMVKFMAPT